MKLEKFMKILKKNNVRFKHGPNSNRIYIDDDIVVNAEGQAFINPAEDFSRFHTFGKDPRALKDVKEDDLKPMIAHYYKFHKYDTNKGIEELQGRY